MDKLMDPFTAISVAVVPIKTTTLKGLISFEFFLPNRKRISGP
jgi:hypothetical protein